MRSLHQTLDPARWAGLSSGESPDPARVFDILERAEALKLLSLDEIAELLRVLRPDLSNAVRSSALKVKERGVGKVIRLFAPLYVSNDCVNNCVYCGFRRDNREAARRTLTPDQVVSEARILERRGFRDIILVASEHPTLASAGTLAAAVDAVRKQTGIRKITVNSAPLAREEFEDLLSAGADVYQSFQETYDPEAYRAVHPSGRKRDYDWRVTVMDRAVRAGFREVGMGVLYGLGDPARDTLALIAHARYLMEEFGIASPGLSLPRLRPAEGAPLRHAPRPVSDTEFMNVVAVCRLALPNSDISISTRERPELRDELALSGASRMSAGSETRPGGYGFPDAKTTDQFAIQDTRSADALVASLCEQGLLPAMETCDIGEGPNRVTCSAFSSMMRYLLHHASPETRAIGEERAVGLVREMFNQAKETRWDPRISVADG